MGINLVNDKGPPTLPRMLIGACLEIGGLDRMWFVLAVHDWCWCNWYMKFMVNISVSIIQVLLSDSWDTVPLECE